MIKKKFPKCEEYGVFYELKDGTKTQDCNTDKVEQALTQAERKGELTGMRNQHEIEKGELIQQKVNYRERIAQLEKELKTAREENKMLRKGQEALKDQLKPI